MKYITLDYATREAVWIRKFINKMKFEAVKNVTLYGNNKMSIALTKNVKSQHWTKQIDIQHYYIKELVSKRILTIKWILRLKILSNGMTKSLPMKMFRKY